MEQYRNNDPWSVRSRELDDTFAPTVPTDSEVELAKMALLQKVTLTDLEVVTGVAENWLVQQAAMIVDSPDGLQTYAAATARISRIDAILAEEGIPQPTPDDYDEAIYF